MNMETHLCQMLTLKYQSNWKRADQIKIWVWTGKMTETQQLKALLRRKNITIS